MDARAGRAAFLEEGARPHREEGLDSRINVAAHPGVGHLRVRQADLARVAQQGRVNFILGAKHNIHETQCGTDGDTEGAGVVPLVRAKVNIQHHGHSGPPRQFGGEQGRAAARLFAQAGAADEQGMTVGNGGG